MTSDLLSRLQSALGAHYSVERELGRGGMATVYLARDLKHDREVALKVLRPELTAILGRERFLNEVRLTAKLDHPHILTLIDSGETDGLLWYVLPLIRGESLRQRLQRERQLGVEDALAITRQIASALEYAHARGVIHRDIKPENVLLHEGEAMLTDFGIALAVKEAGGNRLTESGLSLGTPSYMSPEQATGDRALDARSDVYSLAAVVYEMLAGEPPHTGATVQAVIARLLTERPTRLRTIRDTVPEGIDAAVAKALAKVPADRFPSARAFAASLTATPGEVPPRQGRRSLLWAGGAIAGVAVAALGVLGLLRWRAPVAGTPVKMTSSGDITVAALSPDGTRLAKSARECDSAGHCTFAVVWQDLGGAGELRLADRLGAVRYLEWSPDARQLLFQGTDSVGRFGTFRIAALGGPAQFLGCCAGYFLTTTDTVLLAVLDRSLGWSLRVITPDDGVIHDSTALGRVAGVPAKPSPDGKLIALVDARGDSSQVVTIDRRWRRLDSIAIPRRFKDYPMWDPRGDAVFLKTVSSQGSTLARLERVPVDRRGRLGSPRPMRSLTFSDLGSFSIAGPSRTLLYVEGGEERTVLALTRDHSSSLDFRSRLLRRSTGELGATLSPDGRFISVFSRPAESPRLELSIIPFAGGSEIRVPPPKTDFEDVAWAWNSSRLFYTARDVTRDTVTLFSFDLASSRARAIGRFPSRATLQVVREDLFGWIDDSAGSVVLADTNGVEVRRFPDTDTTERIDRAGGIGGHATGGIGNAERIERSGVVYGSPDGRSLLTSRWTAGFDSLLFARLDLATGHREWLAGLRVEEPSGVFWAPNGTIQVAVLETLQTLAFYRLDQRGGPAVRVGSFPTEGTVYYTFSRDGRRAVEVEGRPRGDVWMVRNFDGRR
jgi:hypothetical protein